MVILKPASQQQAAARIGRAAEFLVAAWLLLRHNIWVSIMPDSSSVDMLLIYQSDNARTVRLQVKSAYTSARGTRLVNLTKSNGSKYTADDIDYVVAVDVECAMFWALPIAVASKYGRIKLDKRFSAYQYDWYDRHPVFSR